MGDAMVIIREYINEMEALVARSVLEAHGVPAIVLRDDAGGMLPSMSIIYPSRLAVRSVDVDEALALLDAPFDDSPMSEESFDDQNLPGVP